MDLETKFNVKIYGKERPARITKELKAELKGVVGGKTLKRMKLEAVDCPVLKKEVPFIDCFACKNHIRRFKGEVHCLGEALTQ